MKKLFSFLALTIGAFVLTSCEDIPAPYQIWSEGNDDNVNAPISYTSASLYTDWSTQAVGENNPWSQGSSYTQATGYQKWDGADTKSNRQAEGFLISPQFNTVSTTGAVKFSFDYCMAYINNDKDWKNHVRIYVSTNFDDTTINLDAWELIDWAPTFSSTDWSLASTGDIALPEAYVNQKNVRIAIWFFAPEKGSSTFEIKNFSIQDGPCVIEGESGSITGGDDTVVSTEKLIPYTSASLYTDWITQAVGENNPWSQGSSYTQATGYQKWGGSTKSNRQAEGFLISPQFNTVSTTGAVKFSFDYCMAYINNDKDWKNHVRIYVTKDYDGATINLATWELINWAPTFSSTDWTLASTGDIALPKAYVNQKNVRIAFWFFAPEKSSSTFELKNFSIQDGPCEEKGESGTISEGGQSDDSGTGRGHDGKRARRL